MKTKPHFRYSAALFRKPSAGTMAAVRLFAGLEARKSSDDASHAVEALSLCPTGSVFEDAVKIAARDTDLPSSLAFFSLLAELASELTQQGFLVRLPDGQTVPPTAWILCLAKSGAGKTFTRTKIATAITTAISPIQLPETMTAASMFSFFSESGLSEADAAPLSDDELSERMFRRCRGLLVRDEAGEWFKKINCSESYMEVKDYILRAYDGQAISRSTIYRGEQTTGSIAMSFYGTAVDESFFSHVKDEDFNNGCRRAFNSTRRCAL